MPSLVRYLVPKGSLKIHEEAWNAYPYCKTVITNPDYMKNNFFICIESMHVQGERFSIRIEMHLVCMKCNSCPFSCCFVSAAQMTVVKRMCTSCRRKN